MEKVLLPIIQNNEIIGTIEFVDNLTLSNRPDYVNENGRIGITRIPSGPHEGELVYMRVDSSDVGDLKNSYAVIISVEEAYHRCLNRGKLDLAEELGLNFMKEREVYEEDEED